VISPKVFKGLLPSLIMREKNGLILVITLLLISLVHSVRADPLDNLENGAINPYAEGALPASMASGDLLEDILGNEIVIGVPEGTLLVMDCNLNTIFSINLNANARKVVIDRVDANSGENGLFVLTDDRTIQIYEGRGAKLHSLVFESISDFLVNNTDSDTQKEIVVTNGPLIESYEFSGERIWSFQGDSDFKKLAYVEKLGYFGGFIASTSDEIYLFSYNGSCLFHRKILVKEVRDFHTWNTSVFILGDSNRIFEFNVKNGELNELYPKKVDQAPLYIHKMYPSELGIIVVGQRGWFQILSCQGRVLAERYLDIEIVGSECVNLDNVQGENIPQDNEYINSPELVISTQIGRIYVYSLQLGTEEYNLETREIYEIKEIEYRYKYITVLPQTAENELYKLIAVDMNGRIHSFSIFLNYYNVLTKFNLALRHYKNHEYHESELLLKEIAEPDNEDQEVERNRSIIKHYGLLELAETYLKKSRDKLRPIIEKGKSEARAGYEGHDHKDIIKYLFLAYQKFQEANIHKNEKVYGSRTLDDLVNELCKHILYLLESADRYYNESNYEQALREFTVVYLPMKTLMNSPTAYIEERGLSEFEDLGERYKDIEEVKKVIIECMSELNESSQKALEDGRLTESRDLNILLMESAKIINSDSSIYESRNKEITMELQKKRDSRLRLTAVILVATIAASALILIVRSARDRILGKTSENKNYPIFYILLTVLATLGAIGIVDFLFLTKDEQVLNLRYTAGSLIQGYIAALAIVPGIVLALMSFFTSRFPPQFARKVWKSNETVAFFLVITFGLAMCTFILISLSDKYLRLKMLGEVFSIGIVLVAIFLLADRIREIFDMEKVLGDIEKNIRDGKELENIFQDLVSIIYSLAENRDLPNLKSTIENFFYLVTTAKRYFDEMETIFSDISLKFEKSNEYFFFEEIEGIIKKGYDTMALILLHP
jgi:hypothetical protein